MESLVLQCYHFAALLAASYSIYKIIKKNFSPKNLIVKNIATKIAAVLNFKNKVEILFLNAQAKFINKLNKAQISFNFSSFLRLKNIKY